jgi:antirestriction protein ArdC
MKAFEVITDRILATLDEGTIPWRKPWKCGGAPRNLITGKPYRGLNVFLVMQGYASPYWLTFKQARDKGGQVRKGEKGTPVVYWNYVSRSVESEVGEIEEKQVPFLRYYTVFNLAQIDGITVPEEQSTN